MNWRNGGGVVVTKEGKKDRPIDKRKTTIFKRKKSL